MDLGAPAQWAQDGLVSVSDSRGGFYRWLHRLDLQELLWSPLDPTPVSFAMGMMSSKL
ncbi:hypothetical protein GCM10010467_30150 [Actinocorallia glomerata]|uniref:Transposase n=1 Tax=Actinocorallia glomerata TaxID=46203 RepID=A0ABP6PVK6_9ACTN